MRWVKSRKLVNRLFTAISLSLLAVFIISSTPNVYLAAGGEVNDDHLKVDKQSEYLGDGKARITFNVNGDVPENVGGNGEGDIVIAINRTGALDSEGNLSKVIEHTKTFIEQVMANNTESKYVRVSLVTYVGLRSGSPDEDIVDSSSCDLTADKDKIIEGPLNNLKNTGGGASNNVEEAMKEVHRQLDESRRNRPNVPRYVIFFSDGLPTISSKTFKFGVNAQSKYYDVDIKMAQIEYNNIVDTLNGVGGIERESDEYQNLGIYGGNKYEPLEILNPDESKYEPVKDVKFYTIGLFSKKSIYYDISGKQNPEEGEAKCIEFLSTIQNVVPIRTIRDLEGNITNISEHNEDLKKYKDKYYTEDAKKIPEIFENVFNEVEEKFNDKLIKESVITDQLSKYFEFPKLDSGEVDYESMQITGIDKNKVKIDGDKITFNTGDIGEEGITISFIVKCTDEYLSGKEIPTNTKANIEGKHPIDQSVMDKEFPIPKIEIPPKTGTLTIEKEIADSDESFSILLKGKDGIGDYGFELKANTSKTMNFYLKDKNTPIDHDTDKNINYLTIGNYEVQEVVPIYNEQVSVLVKYSNDSEWKPLNEPIKINKDSNNIYIKVVNKKVSEKTWWDKANVSNKLTFTSSGSLSR